MHPQVSKELFEREAAAMFSQARFKGGGWEIILAQFPDLIVELPHPSGARRRFRLRCGDWDEKPPSVKSVDTEHNELPGEPTENHFVGWGFCVAGSLEYHERHAEDPWANHRSKLRLANIVMRIANYYRKASA